MTASTTPTAHRGGKEPSSTMGSNHYQKLHLCLMHVSQAPALLLLFSRSLPNFDTSCGKTYQQHRPDVRRTSIHWAFHIWTIWHAIDPQESQGHKPSDWKWRPCAHRSATFVKYFPYESFLRSWKVVLQWLDSSQYLKWCIHQQKYLGSNIWFLLFWLMWSTGSSIS